MPDITMCSGANCPLKDECYRYTAEPSKFRQSYFMNPPIKDGKCEHQMEVYTKNKEDGNSTDNFNSNSVPSV